MSIQVAPALVTIDGLEIGTVDDDGVVLTFNKIDGWHGGPGSRSSFTDRPNDHGSFDARVYRTARVVTISGLATAPSRMAVALKLHKLTAALAEGQLGPVVVDDLDYGTLSISARLTDGPLVDWNSSANQWAWQIQVTAPDPRKYGPPVSVPTNLPAPGSGGLVFPLFQGSGKLQFGTPGTSGRITLVNPGTADAWPTFQVTGPVIGGLSLTDVDSGRQIVWLGDVPDGATLLIIDSTSGHAELNGALRDDQLVTKQWWPVPKFGASTVQFSTLGVAGQTGTLTATIRPSYW